MSEIKGNYIKYLQNKIEVLEGQLTAATWMNDALLDYAQSSKFMGQEGWGGDCYIHKNDVIHRADLTRQALEGTLTGIETTSRGIEIIDYKESA